MGDNWIYDNKYYKIRDMLNDEVLLVDKLTKHIQSKIITTDGIHRYTYPVDDYFMDVYAEDIDELLKYIFKKDYDKQKVEYMIYFFL